VNTDESISSTHSTPDDDDDVPTSFEPEQTQPDADDNRDSA
jgi:hypothetical protein